MSDFDWSITEEQAKVAEHVNSRRQQLAADEARLNRILEIKAKTCDSLTYEEKILIVPVLVREINAEEKRRERSKNQ